MVWVYFSTLHSAKNFRRSFASLDIYSGGLILQNCAGKCIEFCGQDDQWRLSFKFSRMGDLYHKAARDSVLELLKTATKRDANRRDEDGMSPVHYAASCGNVEALRLLVGKGYV